MATATDDRPKNAKSKDAAAAKDKEKAAKAKEKEKAAKAKDKEKAAKAKDKDKATGGRAGTAPKGRSGSTGPARSTSSRSGSPEPEVHEKGWIAEELGKADAVERSTKRPTLAASFTTRDHDVIRRWAESRGGVPADVRGTGDGGKGGSGVLRIEFRDEADRLEQVEWDTFFETFETSDVDFLYQEYTKDGGESRFHKIVRADD